MATAAELLAGMTTGDDTTLVIDNYLRVIQIPKRITNLGVEHDGEVLTLNFKMPRYLDDTDLSNFAIRINYINANGDSDAFTVNDNKKTVTTEHILFSWLVGPTATAYKGETKFNVCMKTMKTVDGQHVIDKEYNTTVASLPVLEGLEVDDTIVQQYSDIIEQWRQELFGTEQSLMTTINSAREKAEKFIELKGEEVLATIPEVYQETSEAAQEGIRTKADAIKSTAEGELIRVSDSSDDHLRGLRIFGKTTQISTTGKNLFDVSGIVGHTSLINNDGVITVITPSASTAVSTDKTLSVLAPLLEVGESYVLTFDTTGSSNYIYLEGENRLWTSGNTLTMTQSILDSTVLLYASGVSTVAKLSNMMIRPASVIDSTYEPYTTGVASPTPTMFQPLTTLDNPNIAVYGKNLINCDNITLDEVDEYYHTFDTGFEPIIGETYTLSMDVTTNVFPFAINIGCGQTAYHSDMTPKISGSYSENGRAILTFVWQLTPTQLSKNYTKLYIRAPRYGTMTTFKATVSNIQLELGSTATEYEPYREAQTFGVQYSLPGVPVISDGNYTDPIGQQWVCDEVDFGRGVYVQNVHKFILDGTENISREERSNSTYRYVIRQYSPVKVKPTLGGYCSHFKYNIAPIGANDVNDVLSLWNTGYPYCRCDSIASVEDMTSWLLQQYEAGTPVTIMGVLETPIETPLTATELEAFKALCSNFPNTVVQNDSGAHMELTYNVDTKTYVDNGIKQTVAEVMEAIENGSY